MKTSLENVQILWERDICDVGESRRDALNVHFDGVFSRAELGKFFVNQESCVDNVLLLKPPLKTFNILFKLTFLVEYKLILF